MKPEHERQLPKQVDAFKLCQLGSSVTGYVDLESLPRLAAALGGAAQADMRLHPALQFSQDEQGHYIVHGELQLTAPLICQRCLDVMQYEVNSTFHCAFVTSDDQAKQLPPELEPVMLTPESSYVDLYDMLEDEVLLCLPIAAMQDHCEGDKVTKSFGNRDTETASAGEKPFAALAGLFKKES